MSYPEDLREAADTALGALSFSSRPATRGLEEAMRYSLLAGGKRIRPVLCLATARSLGKPLDIFLPASCAIEMIHTYSLVHDDLPAMDDDEMRRGRPTAHVEFGEGVAILAGDALFAEAMAILAAGPWQDDRKVEAITILSSAAGVDGMVGGQYIDVTAEGLDPGLLVELHGLKTGRLISASVEIALALDGVPVSERSEYLEFAGELGVLFQIVDDILDVTGAPEATGKPTGSDERLGKITYASLHGLERARQLASESHRRAVESLGRVSGDTDSLRAVADYIQDRDR